MAASSLSVESSNTNIDDMNLEMFCIIWLDSNVKATENQAIEKKLRSIINRFKRFHDVSQCQKYIHERSPYERLFMITSGRLGQEIVPTIQNARQVISIYVYCMDKKRNKLWAEKHKKVKGVFTDFEKLLSDIKADFKIQKIIEEPLSLNIFTPDSSAGGSAISTNGNFVSSQILINCLLRLRPNEVDKKELINICEKAYQENDSEMKNIKEFRKKYSSDKALSWYSRDSFFYDTLNTVLYTENIHMIFLFRGFISDIQHQLQSAQAQTPLRAYRGLMISKDEINILKQHHGQFISINSFFSTNSDYQKALSYFNDSDSHGDVERVVFEIYVDPRAINTKPFAYISQFSEYSDKSEVLFMAGSIFRLHSIDRPFESKFWIIRMTLCGENENNLSNVLMYIKQLGTGETNLEMLSKILLKMRKFDLVEKYLTRFLNELPLNHPSRENVNKLLAQVGSYSKTTPSDQKSFEHIKQVPKQSDTKDIREISLPDASGFDVNLCTSRNDPQQQTCFIRRVQQFSIADKAGLCVGDRILAVNGTDVTNFPHGDVYCLVHTKKPLKLTVVQDSKCLELIEGTRPNRTEIKMKVNRNISVPPGYKSFEQEKSRGSTANAHLAVRGIESNTVLKSTYSKAEPRKPMDEDVPIFSLNLFTDDKGSVKVKHCVLRKDPTYNGYGFVLLYQNGLHLIEHVEQSSPAYIAGLRADDVILYVGKRNVEQVTHNSIKEIIRDLSSSNMNIDLILIKNSDIARYKSYGEQCNIDWRPILNGTLARVTRPY